MLINFEDIEIIRAEKNSESHRNGFWVVRNENTTYNLTNPELISFENHCIWWDNVFNKEYMYCIYYKSEFCGYLRLTKEVSETKEKNEISIAIAKKFQNTGIGTYAYKMFEDVMNKIGIKEIIALTHIENKAGQRFFEKNDFKKTIIKKEFIKYYKKI